ncbi:TadE/TadG family type IV pilus assembly protein [Yoonia sp. I 8.24]|uniref:TadE/TadG family type IV pilus assembly protein n=1 Tax=Yoonia sp. I 8.24 TaxID=1537229 RepID=UPI001EDEA8C3|nr:TadE/TadG family type IV pilus assembly protein [Yoonia sp. I 8.24]MCG3268875.1 pilus assembly protein [Yoonia sp. I 8.24]
MMMRLRKWVRTFVADDSGVVTVEFLIVFPIFFGFFLMTYEMGIISVRNVMLERGIDMAVREVRIGVMAEPTSALLKESICDYAKILPDCENQLELEMLVRDVRAWVDIPTDVACVDRSVVTQAAVEFSNLGNNDIVFLRACIRIDPMLPTTGIGKAIVDAAEGDDAAGSSYALIASASFVVEPFADED